MGNTNRKYTACQQQELQHVSGRPKYCSFREYAKDHFAHVGDCMKFFNHDNATEWTLTRDEVGLFLQSIPSQTAIANRSEIDATGMYSQFGSLMGNDNARFVMNTGVNVEVSVDAEEQVLVFKVNDFMRYSFPM